MPAAPTTAGAALAAAAPHPRGAARGGVSLLGIAHRQWEAAGAYWRGGFAVPWVTPRVRAVSPLHPSTEATAKSYPRAFCL